MKNAKLDTALVHGGEPKPPVGRSIVMPIFQSVTYTFAAEGSYHDVWYARSNNTPSQVAVSNKAAIAEGAEAAVATASGMAAITTALLALVPAGGHVLAQDGLYGGTQTFLREHFESLGRSVTFFPYAQTDRLDEWVKPETKAIYVESATNPCLRIVDIPKVVAFAKRRGLVSLIDNTFPSPFNFNPIAHGIDVVLHSATKYLNGHSDVVAGFVLGRKAHVEKVTHLLTLMGGSLDPHACFLLQRGMKTLGVRMRAHNENAMRLAQALERHRKVKHVYYPGLPSHPEHALAKELFRGFGGMLSFDYDGTAEECNALLTRLELAYFATSLGGVESLVSRPATSSHAGLSAEERKKCGISDTLVRVSVGIEDADDLIADFQRALG